MLKKLATKSIACSLLTAAVCSYAADASYIGVQTGQGNTHYANHDAYIADVGADLEPNTLSIHNKTLAGRLFVGYEFNQNMAAELGFQHLGNTKFNALDNISQKGYVKEFAYDAAIKPSVSVGEQAKFYAKLGAAYVRAISHEQLIGTHNQIRPIYGVGISAGNTTKAPVFVEWSRIHRSGSIPHADLVSLGVKYYFDQSQEKLSQQANEAAVSASFTTEMKNAGVKVQQEENKTYLDIPSQVSFDFNKANIKPGFKATLDKIAEYLEQHPAVTASIEGHTDSIGSQGYNQRLSERRALSVYRYLTSKGILQKRLTTNGYGKLHPIASNATEEGRAQNRRVELIIQQ